MCGGFCSSCRAEAISTLGNLGVDAVIARRPSPGLNVLRATACSVFSEERNSQLGMVRHEDCGRLHVLRCAVEDPLFLRSSPRGTEAQVFNADRSFVLQKPARNLPTGAADRTDYRSPEGPAVIAVRLNDG